LPRHLHQLRRSVCNQVCEKHQCPWHGLVGNGFVAMILVMLARAPMSEGYPKVIELTEKDEDLKATIFSLGIPGKFPR